MHFYIYPNGGNAKYLAYYVEFFNKLENRSDTYEFLDDKIQDTSLENKAKDISKNVEGGGVIIS